jgi:hypothetical protein
MITSRYGVKQRHIFEIIKMISNHFYSRMSILWQRISIRIAPKLKRRRYGVEKWRLRHYQERWMFLLRFTLIDLFLHSLLNRMEGQKRRVVRMGLFDWRIISIYLDWDSIIMDFRRYRAVTRFRGGLLAIFLI